MRPTPTATPALHVAHDAYAAPDDLLTETEAAASLRVAVQTLRNWRWRGTGPRYRKIGQRLVRYARSDLQAFIAGDAPEGRAA